MDPRDRDEFCQQTFAGRLDQLSAISEFALQAAQHMGMDELDLFSVQMAVDEAATNIIVHGYQERELQGSVHVLCWQERGDFVVQLRDSSPPFDPAQVPRPDLNAPLKKRQEGGLGIFLMRRMMDRVEFSREGEENVLTMSRRLAASAGLPPSAIEICLQGRIDATRSRDLTDLLGEPIEGGRRFLVLNFSQVSYISSSGLRVLLVAAKRLRRQRGNLLLCCPVPSVARVLRITGFNKIFPLYETRDAAVQALEEICESGT